MHPPLQQADCIVIKLGTGVLTGEDGHIDVAQIRRISDEVSKLKATGKKILVVSSGAVGLGMARLGLKRKPIKQSALQKCAAVGQSLLTETWQQAFTPHSITVAQLLLTHEDVRSRTRHLTAKNLVEELIADGIVPIINENDSVRTDEIKFGDNDILAALISSLCKADLLAILSTANGLENRCGDGKVIPIVEEITPELEAMAEGTESTTGTGGMISKLQAAKIANRSGCSVFIGNGKNPALLSKLFKGQAKGTLFIPKKLSLKSRKRWIAFFATAYGGIYIDPGAEQALRHKGSSLLAKGITHCQGSWEPGQVINIFNQNGSPVARGICQYSSQEVSRVTGKDSKEVLKIFPKHHRHEIIHRDSLVIL